MSVHLDLAVTQDGLISHNGIRTDDCDDDYDAEEDEEEEDDDNETGVGEVQEVVAAGMFDWMGLSSTIAPIIVPVAEGESSDLVSFYSFVNLNASYFILLFHITSFLSIISYHIISYHIISHHIITYHIISHHITSYHIISHHIISHHIISYHIISYHFIIIII